MSLPLHSQDPDFDYSRFLRELPGLGVTHVLVIVQFHQRDAASAAPARHPLKTPSDAVVLGALRYARALKLEAALMPILALEQPGRDWRGNIAPRGHDGRLDWGTWFAAYGRVMTHYARLAQRGGATLFSVGSELSSTEGEHARWSALVREVRQVFTGELTYSANWDHFQHVKVWRELDYIGLSGYYELASSATPRPAELRASWIGVRERLLRWRADQRLEDRPLLFTELGYASLDGCAQKPWDYIPRDRRVDLLEQRDCYQAFVEAWQGQRALAGVYFYEWWGEGGREDRGYTPRGKPAIEVLRAWFGGPRRAR
ncbi:MAG: hypothetical protein AB7N76_09285 [Planctomycetota bacterium]